MSIDFEFDGVFDGPADLGTATLGTAWANIGTAFKIAGAKILRVFADITINDSQDPRFRLLAKHTEGGSGFFDSMQTESGGVVTAQGEYIEFADDADQKRSFEIQLNGSVPWGQLQAQVGTAGGTAATLNECQIIAAR